jgi:4-amino-4-deoxy-L-arabinose transferase-like glycosyltransferase
LLRFVKPGFTGALLLLFLGALVLPYPGVQTDEALFGSQIYYSSGFVDRVRWGREIPTMLLSYLGALKTWLYWPWLSLVKANVWTIRLPMLLLGCGTVILFARLLQRVHGVRAAWIGALLLAADPSFLLTTTFDWGPVAIQQFLLTAAVALLVAFHQEDGKRQWRWALAWFLLGLALWNKALVLWIFAGAGVAFLAVFPHVIRRYLNLKLILIAALCFAAGSAWFIRYNIRKQAATAGNVQLDTSELTHKAMLLRDTLNGSSLMGYLFADPPGTVRRESWTPYALGAALILSLLWPSRSVWFAWIVLAAAWSAMAVTKGAGGGAHHTVLLWPLPQWILAAAFTAPRVKWPTLAPAAVAMILASQLWVYALYLDLGRRYSSPYAWSDAIFGVAAHVERTRPRAVHVFDWGMFDNTALLLQRNPGLSFHGPPYEAAIFETKPDEIWLGYLDPYQNFPGVNEGLRKAYTEAGFEKELVARIRDRSGAEIFEFFRLRKKN